VLGVEPWLGGKSFMGAEMRFSGWAMFKGNVHYDLEILIK